MSKPTELAPLPSPIRRNWLFWSMQMVCRLLCAVWFRYRCRGLDRLPEGGVLLLINHQSHLDAVLAGIWLKRPFSLMARHDLYEIPILGRLLKGMYGMSINRDAPGTAALREIIRRAEYGFIVGIFPEGTRSTGIQLGELKPGFVTVIRRTKVPIIPVGIAGAHIAMPRDSKFIWPTTIRVVFGDPIARETLDPLMKRDKEPELLDTIREQMQACIDEAEAWRTGRPA